MIHLVEIADAQYPGEEVMDHVYEYLKSLGPVTREDYINLNWMGDIDGATYRNKPLEAELEAELPEELQCN